MILLTSFIFGLALYWTVSTFSSWVAYLLNALTRHVGQMIGITVLEGTEKEMLRSSNIGCIVSSIAWGMFYFFTHI